MQLTLVHVRLGYSGIRTFIPDILNILLRWAVCYTEKSAFFSNVSKENRRLREGTRSIFYSASFFLSSLSSWSHCKYSFLDLTPFSFFESLFFFCKENWLHWLAPGLFNTTVTSSSFLSSSFLSYGFLLVKRSEGARNPPSGAAAFRIQANIRPVTIELCIFMVKWAFFSVISRNTVVVSTLAKSKCRGFPLSLNVLRSCAKVRIFYRY